jgi:hypothetical protein
LDIKLALTEQGMHDVFFSEEPTPKNELLKKSTIGIRVISCPLCNRKPDLKGLNLTKPELAVQTVKNVFGQSLVILMVKPRGLSNATNPK